MTDLELALADLAVPAPPSLAPRVAAGIAAVDRFVHEETADGPLWVAFGPSGINLTYLAPDEATFRAAYAVRWADPDRPLVPAATAPKGLRAVLDGHKSARALRYDLTGCSPFQQAVLAKTAEIPRGEVRSYGWVAKEIGQDAAVRAVGTALGRNPVPVLIPCHRVVRTDGRIGNYGFGTPVKVRLLTGEGVDLEELGRMAAGGMRYVGSATTHIFCVPTCHAARRIRSPNRVTFRSSRDALAGGYRPCQHCRPSGALVSTG
ncbi:MAG: methylated-DNA--[protein]-cysteine S-methyltransferase [Acidimicrobiales bacterium]